MLLFLNLSLFFWESFENKKVMNEKLELIFFEALEVRKHKVKISFLY